MGISWKLTWLLALLGKASALQWTHTASLSNNVTIPACIGQDVTLPWNYTLGGGERVLDVEWYFTPNDGSGQRILGSLVNGHFLSERDGDQHVAYIRDAGIRLLAVAADTGGTYSVTVNVNDQGAVTAHSQSIIVDVTATPITTTTELQAFFVGAKFLNSSQEDHLILVCGNFSRMWTSVVDVVWTTPMGASLPTTYQDDDQYYLAVPNPFVSGEYTCSLNQSSPATLCVTGDSPLKRGATVEVDGVEGRIALLASQLQSLREKETQTAGEMAAMQANNTALIQQVQQLQTENTDMRAVLESLQAQTANLTDHIYPTYSNAIRLVAGPNSHEGRVEVQVGGVWGTVCDDFWTVQEARVVCRQLGLPTGHPVPYPRAHYGRGSGDIVMDQVTCQGDEARLQDCSFIGTSGQDCTHSEDAGVACQ